MGRKQTYPVTLSQGERDHLTNLVSTGVEQAQTLTRARILLRADEGWTDEAIAQALDVGVATVGRVRRRYQAGGLDAAIQRQRPNREYVRKVDGETEAHLIALACSAPPAGYADWTLRLLAERLVRLESVDLTSISHETVRQVLKKTRSSRGSKKNG
jgi:transposase